MIILGLIYQSSLFHSYTLNKFSRKQKVFSKLTIQLTDKWKNVICKGCFAPKICTVHLQNLIFPSFTKMFIDLARSWTFEFEILNFFCQEMYIHTIRLYSIRESGDNDRRLGSKALPLRWQYSSHTDCPNTDQPR